jgi:RNA polymerase sporulation-specific sigma factor
MRQYDNLSDETLIHLSKNGDRAAEDTLAERYARLVKICARPYFLAGGDSEDLIQEGMLGLISAIREYDPRHSVPFKTFAEQCVKNRIISAVRAAARMKHSPLNTGLSLDDTGAEDLHTRFAHVPEVFRRIPEELVLDRESADELVYSFPQCLSRLESEVLLLYLDGHSYREMAECLHRSPKSIDNAVQRIRQKLAQYLSGR